MALRPTALVLTPTWSNKGLTITGGNPAAHEKQVNLTIIGAATDLGAVPDGLVVRLMYSPICDACHIPYATPSLDAIELARFPLAAGDAWNVSGSDVTGVLDLDTVAIEDLFAGRGMSAVIDAVCTIESGTVDTLYASGAIRIRNWVINSEDPVVGSSVLKTRVDTLEENLAAEIAERAEADQAEADVRGAEDLALAGQLAGKVSTAAFDQAVADIAGSILAETQARENADAGLAASLAGKADSAALTLETQQRIEADQDEALTRASADAALGVQLSGKASAAALAAESNARVAADEAEAEARTVADNALTAEIATKQPKPDADALTALNNFELLPEEYTDADVRTKLNAFIELVKGLFA